MEIKSEQELILLINQYRNDPVIVFYNNFMLNVLQHSPLQLSVEAENLIIIAQEIIKLHQQKHYKELFYDI